MAHLTVAERAVLAGGIVGEAVAQSHVVTRHMRKHDPLSQADHGWLGEEARLRLDALVVPLSIYLDVRSRDLAERGQWERVTAPLAAFEAELGIWPSEFLARD